MNFLCFSQQQFDQTGHTAILGLNSGQGVVSKFATQMKLKLLGAAVAAATLAASTAHATEYLGQGSYNGASYTMYITTNGATGVLVRSDITAWDLTLSDSNNTVELNQSSSSLYFYHNYFTAVDDADLFSSDNGYLTATPDALSFNFDGAFSDASGIFFQGNSFPPGSDLLDTGTLCIQGRGCFDETSGSGFGVAGDGYDYTYIPVTGNIVIAEKYVPPGTPEPATWAMMMLGVFGMGAMLRRRRALAGLA